MSRQPGDLGPRGPERAGPGGAGTDRSWRFVLMVVLSLVVVVLLIGLALPRNGPATVSYGKFTTELNAHQLKKVSYDQQNGLLEFTTTSGQTYQAQGPAT